MGQIGDTVSNHLQQSTEEMFRVEPDTETDLDRARLADALTELHRLLEEYAPSWYTQKHHEKVQAALRSGRH